MGTPPPPPPRPAAPLAARPPPPPMPPRAPAAGAAPVLRMPPADPTTEIAGTRSEHRVKMNRMRMKIASRLKDAQNTNAMLTTFNELDMSAIMQLRKDNQDAFVKKHGIKMGFMSAFVKASAYALTKQPTVNAVIEGQETVYRDFVDISVAVATPKGLVVPVLRNVERMNYADIEKGIAELGKKAKNNQISIEDMDGGTFTISNGGVFGSLFGTPIINPPQSAILENYQERRRGPQNHADGPLEDLLLNHHHQKKLPCQNGLKRSPTIILVSYTVSLDIDVYGRIKEKMI